MDAKLPRREFIAISSIALFCSSRSFAGEGVGRIETLRNKSNAVSPRIRVWLPPAYDGSDRRFPVLYMLDGQWAFAGDEAGTNFRADTRIADLASDGTIRPHIVVAIDNLGEKRFLQYMPQAIYDAAGPDLRDSIEREIERINADKLVSSEFLSFLEGELIPQIDAEYRTLRDRNERAIFGASMAGAMAGAIFVEAKSSFGRAACMSPNWPLYDERFIDHPGLPQLWAEFFAQLGAPEGRRLWLDHGTQMMDAGMASHQRAIAKRLGNLGWRRGCNLQTRVYEAGHAIAQSAVQMDEVLAWLLV